MKSLLFLTTLTLLAYTVYTVRGWLTPREHGLLVTVAVVCTLALTFLLYPSDPRAWTLAGFVLYMNDVRFELLRVVGKTLTGAALFTPAVLGIYWANERRMKKKKRRG